MQRHIRAPPRGCPPFCDDPVLHKLISVVGLLVLAAAAITFGLQVTPTQSVSTLGQTVEVGAAAPTFSLSGPGELDLFGQALPTKVRFTGPVRPRLVLTKITIDRQVANFLEPNDRAASATSLGKELAAGWTRYFVWEAVFVALGALLLAAAFLGVRHRSWRRSVVVLAVALVVTEGINLGAIMVTAYSAPRLLRQVHSLGQLVGQSEQPPIPSAPGPTTHGVQAVVLGDSTAAGLGLPPLSHPTALDTGCYRSADAAAVDLAAVNAWNVENLACSGATIPAGLLGPQHLGAVTAPAQLAAAKRASGVKAIFVSVGADDLRWSVMVRLCAATKTCDDAASTAYFQSKLHQFTKHYYALLSQLAAFPGHPQVVINRYYVPFDPKAHCLAHVGLTAAKQKVLLQRLGALNAVLAKGATASGFLSVQPDFTGHQLCSAQPYVQGLGDKAPFHPTQSGQLAIALADETALRRGG